LETNGLFEEGQYLLGSGYVAGTLGVCLGGVFLGRVVGRALMNQ
jgi:fluoride ion exporter CrcB/FEX